MSGSNQFNKSLPKFQNHSDDDLFSNENGSHNPKNSIFDSDGCSYDQNPNNGASQSDCMEYLEKQQDQDNIDLNEDKQAHNEGNDIARIINLTEDSKEDFLSENTFTSQIFDLANGNNNTKLPFEGFDFQNNHSLTEQRSTSLDTLIFSQKFNSGTNEGNNGANNSENNFAINSENNAADSESVKKGKVEMEEEESQKFDLIKDSKSNHNSGNTHSEEIKGKNKDSFHKDFGDINKTNTLNKNGNANDFEKGDSSFGMNNFSKKDNPIFACQTIKDKKNCSVLSPGLGQGELDEERVEILGIPKKNLSKISDVGARGADAFNVARNSLVDDLSGKSSNVNYAEIGNNINSNDISKKNDSLNNLLSKKRKRERKKIFEINKSAKYGKRLEDKKKLNSDKNGKFFVIKNNNELKQEPKVAINSSPPPQTNSMKNDKSVKQNKNQDKIFKVLEYYRISKEIKSKEEIIKKKRDKIEGIFRSKLPLVKGKSERQLNLGDIQRYNYRKFKKYLKKKKDEYKLNNYFWDAFFAPKKDGEPVLELTINKENIKFKSHSQKLMTFLFSIDGISDLYENLLKDKDFQNNYEVDKEIPNVYIYKFYGKNLHKIYCDKYEESDLDGDMEK